MNFGQRLAIGILIAVMFVMAVFLGIQAYRVVTVIRVGYPDRNACPNVYKTKKIPRFKCSGCHTDGYAEFLPAGDMSGKR